MTIFAAGAMALSSVTVVSNALRLRRFTPSSVAHVPAQIPTEDSFSAPDTLSSGRLERPEADDRSPSRA